MIFVNSSWWRVNCRAALKIAGSYGRPMVIVAFCTTALVMPVLFDLARYYWVTPAGAQGPIILTTGIWLFWRERHNLRFTPGMMSSRWLGLLAPMLILHLMSRGLHLIGTETLTCLLVVLLLALFYIGPAAMRDLRFAWLYLFFLVKPPQDFITTLTGPLQIALSHWSVKLLRLADYPIGASGVAIQVGQYELLVAQACAGLGSLFALLAIAFLYVHLTRPSGRMHILLLLIGIVPIAVFANFLRIIIIILLTYHVSDGVAQSFAHELAGMLTFLLSLLALATLDGALGFAPRLTRQ